MPFQVGAPTLLPMFSRIGRVGTLALCAAALTGALSAGIADASPRAGKSVIGGTVANVDQWSFAAAVLTPRTLCTGTVLSPTKILTAGHCVGNPLTMTVRTKSDYAYSGGEALPVKSAVFAPGFNHTFENDLAILTLAVPTTATPIQLATAAEDATYTQPGAPLSIAGFGNRNPILVGKPKIGLLTTASVSAKFCNAPTWVICDSGHRVGVAFRRLGRKVKRRPVNRSVCSGDSGGPLVADTPQGPRLIGTAELSLGPASKRNPFFYVICGLKGYPSVHTRSLLFNDFIQANLTP